MAEFPRCVVWLLVALVILPGTVLRVLPARYRDMIHDSNFEEIVEGSYVGVLAPAFMQVINGKPAFHGPFALYLLGAIGGAIGGYIVWDRRVRREAAKSD